MLLIFCLAPGARASGVGSSERAPSGAPPWLPIVGDADARLVPWETLRRLALEAGLQPPIDEPISAAEWRRLEKSIAAASAQGNFDPAEREAIAALAAAPPARSRLGARLLLGSGDHGRIVPGQAGLAWGGGWNATAEAGGQASRGRWWGAVTGRFTAVTGWGAEPVSSADSASPIFWPGWDPATGPAQQRRALLLDEGTSLDLVRAIVGVETGRWGLSAGWEPRRDGPGLSGALLLDRDGSPFPALTARRLAPFRWRGIMRPIAPQQLLLRAGLLSRRPVTDPQAGAGGRLDRPWFFQWLVRWRVTDWFRFGCSQTAVAVPREGTLWPDLLQINFPVVGTTRREQDSGPFTDRLFAVQMEFRWRHAPWRWLPSAAGRAWWEYAGTDFLPSGPGGLVPRIAAPASVAGFELVGPRWDLALEYAETLHPLVLWYSNGAFPDGYTQRGRLLGHPLGGAGEQLSALVRWRPRVRGGAWFAELGVFGTRWGDQGHAPARARERGANLTLGRLSRGLPGPWRAHAGWRREEAITGADVARRQGWNLALERRF